MGMSLAQERSIPVEASQIYTQTLSTSAESDFTLGDGGVITKYTGDGGNVVIPSTIDGRTVYGIGEKAFQNKTNIDSITMPSTLERIEAYAFSGCSNIRTVNLNEGLYYIGEYSFEKNTNLSSIWFPSSVTEIAIAAFYLSGLTSAYVPSTVKTMGASVFFECPRMKSAIIMADIDRLPEKTFYATEQLEDVYLREGIVTIGELAFYNCTALKEITLPTTTKHIEPEVFAACTKLEKFDMTNSVLYQIDDKAFYGCTSLTEVILPYGFGQFTSSAKYSSPALFLNVPLW